MIVSKNKIKPFLPPQEEVKHPEPDNPTVEFDIFEANPLSEIYRAVASILRDIKEDPDNPDSPPLFKTVKMNQGQLARIRRDKMNEQGALAFPAAFIHLINIHWLTQTSRIGEARADLRIAFVLNRLNVEDDEFQTEGYDICQRISQAIEKNRSKFTPLTERCLFKYFDPVESMDEGLQQYWMTYEVWFRDYSGYKYKDYVDVNVVIPPFTNHSDQNDEANPNHLPNCPGPSFNDVSGFDETSEQPLD